VHTCDDTLMVFFPFSLPPDAARYRNNSLKERGCRRVAFESGRPASRRGEYHTTIVRSVPGFSDISSILAVLFGSCTDPPTARDPDALPKLPIRVNRFEPASAKFVLGEE
jgi:hypothetical protein